MPSFALILAPESTRAHTSLVLLFKAARCKIVLSYWSMAGNQEYLSSLTLCFRLLFNVTDVISCNVLNMLAILWSNSALAPSKPIFSHKSSYVQLAKSLIMHLSFNSAFHREPFNITICI